MRGLVRQLLDIDIDLDIDKARLIIFKGFLRLIVVFWLGHLRLEMGGHADASTDPNPSVTRSDG